MKKYANQKSRHILFAGSLLALISNYSNAVDLTINVEEIKNTTGVIRMAIHDSDLAFEKADLSSAVIAFQIRADLHSVSIDGLPPGTYAIAAHHDENNDGKLEKGFIFAIEGYSFSKGASCWSVPTFDDASFILDKNKSNVVIIMKYC